MQAGNVLVTGAARFANGFYGIPNESKNINAVDVSSTLNNNYYIIMSNGTSLIRVSYSDFINDLAGKVSVEFADSEGVAY